MHLETIGKNQVMNRSWASFSLYRSSFFAIGDTVRFPRPLTRYSGNVGELTNPLELT